MLDTKQELDIFSIRLDEAQYQPDESKIQLLAESIREKGLISPIAVNAEQQLMAGYHRLLAYKRLYQQDGDTYRHIPVRYVDTADSHQIQQLETTEKLFHPELSILEKAGHFKAYFDGLKYGQIRHKTTAILETLDISRRTFFNLRAIAERLGEGVQNRIRQSSHPELANSTPQLLALCKFDEATQLQVLDLLEQQQLPTIFEAIHAHQQEEQQQRKIRNPFLKSPSLKLERELRDELRQLSKQSGVGQNELFNEIFAAGLELIQRKYR